MAIANFCYGPGLPLEYNGRHVRDRIYFSGGDRHWNDGAGDRFDARPGGLADHASEPHGGWSETWRGKGAGAGRVSGREPTDRRRAGGRRGGVGDWIDGV